MKVNKLTCKPNSQSILTFESLKSDIWRVRLTFEFVYQVHKITSLLTYQLRIREAVKSNSSNEQTHRIQTRQTTNSLNGALGLGSARAQLVKKSDGQER